MSYLPGTTLVSHCRGSILLLKDYQSLRDISYHQTKQQEKLSKMTSIMKQLLFVSLFLNFSICTSLTELTSSRPECNKEIMRAGIIAPFWRLRFNDSK